MERAACAVFVIAGGLAFFAPVALRASAPVLLAVEYSREMTQFLGRTEEPRQYRALRRLEAENASTGTRGWMHAWTEFAPGVGFSYDVVAEGGSGSIRSRVLRAVLEGERNLIASGRTTESAITLSNYRFEPDGTEANLVKMLLSPRRKDVVLLDGAMFLTPDDGELVRLEGRLAKNPSVWVRRVDIVRHYRRIQGVLLPVGLESTAQMRFLGPSTLRMSYEYTAIDGRPVGENERPADGDAKK